MNNSVSFDIIIPVYNTKRNLLTQSIDSVLNQSYSNYRLIVVDDGSTNQEIISLLKDYSEANLLTLLAKENSGSADARNLGLDNVKSDYFIFLDSDDYLESNILQILNNVLSKTPYDIVFFGLRMEDRGKTVQKNIPSELLAYEDLLNMCDNSTRIWANSSVVSKCYSSKYKDHKFVSGLSYGEDKIYLFELYRKRRLSIKTLQNIGYVNVVNRQSMTNSFSIKSVELIHRYCEYFINYCLPNTENGNRVCYKLLYGSIRYIIEKYPISLNISKYHSNLNTILRDGVFNYILKNALSSTDNIKDYITIELLIHKKPIFARINNSKLFRGLYKLVSLLNG
ncbi:MULTISPECIES: glycosyltransferase family 2 protein [unclassified Blautia]|uniref:glycosyltransferase family 2 protein n=1 Tax=unclassified Blautia TaxID=2648079 RepID=UPI003F88681E